MEKPQFVIKPALLNALVPHYARWFWRFGIAAAIVYFIFIGLEQLGMVSVYHPALLISVIVVGFLGGFVMVKHRLIGLHNTRYSFYTSHVVRERRFITVKRHSLPYRSITKVENDSSVWDRMTGASDLILHTSHGDQKALVLESVPDSDAVEHRIYALMRKEKGENSEPKE